MIKTENLTFSYKQEGLVFNFPDIVLDKQENLLVIGKSGIGKTTLLHLLAGVLKPTFGSVLVNNIAITSLSAGKLDAFRGEHIGLVFQKNYAVRSLTVLENLKARLFFSKKAIDISVIDQLLRELDLFECKHYQLKELSEGQLQRLSIALSVVHQPKVILADEPTSSLDDENCNKVIELLQQQAEKNSANLIVITHDHRIQSFFQNSITL